MVFSAYDCRCAMARKFQMSIYFAYLIKAAIYALSSDCCAITASTHPISFLNYSILVQTLAINLFLLFVCPGRLRFCIWSRVPHFIIFGFFMIAVIVLGFIVESIRLTNCSWTGLGWGIACAHALAAFGARFFLRSSFRQFELILWVRGRAWLAIGFENDSCTADHIQFLHTLLCAYILLWFPGWWRPPALVCSQSIADLAP